MQKDSTETGILVSDVFDSKVMKGDHCWEWAGSLCNQGYGSVTWKGRKRGAHRVVFEYIHGGLSRSLYVCHKCDNRKCVRPSHLFAGTAAENNADMWAKGRGSSGWKPLPGEKNPQAKLTLRDVVAIKKLITLGVKQKDLSIAYEVSTQQISDIARGRRWSHVDK